MMKQMGKGKMPTLPATGAPGGAEALAFALLQHNEKGTDSTWQ